MRNASFITCLLLTAICRPAHADGHSLTAAQLKQEQTVAAEADRLLNETLTRQNLPLAPRTSDEDFLRRITLDLAGHIPTPKQATLFALNPDPRKREKLADELLASPMFAENWGRYWRDVIFSRATDQRARLAQPGFERWITDQLNQNKPWNQIATSLLTATGDVREEGATGLIFAQGAMPQEIAAEASRIFLGIQIQCANCHDHPSDVWKRQDFHELAAFFPRMRVQPVRDGQQTRSFEIVSVDNSRRGGGLEFLRDPQGLMRRFDKNKDDKLTAAEVKDSRIEGVFDRLLRIGDTNQDQALSVAEFRSLPAPPERLGSEEYYMPDLADPASPGTVVEPLFFASKNEVESGLPDADRRLTLAKQMTDPANPWFARAFVNRIWAELTGEGFYMPIDDLGPTREARFPEVLATLSEGFVASGHDVKWLYRTITLTEAYQRQARAKSNPEEVPFAAAQPTRLRADQIYDSLMQALGLQPSAGNFNNRYGRGRQDGRTQFAELFGFDPSTPQTEITGDVPQALFMMNSPLLNSAIQARGNTRLALILQKYDKDADAVSELYLLILAREPSEKELKICRDYIARVNNRGEAYEDLMWSLLNSTEFVTKR